MIIDLTPYCQNIDNAVYTLKSIICHKGNKSTSGHYVSLTYDDKAKMFTRCDDLTISKTYPEETLQDCYVAVYDRLCHDIPKTSGLPLMAYWPIQQGVRFVPVT